MTVYEMGRKVDDLLVCLPVCLLNAPHLQDGPAISPEAFCELASGTWEENLYVQGEPLRLMLTASLGLSCNHSCLFLRLYNSILY